MTFREYPTGEDTGGMFDQRGSRRIGDPLRKIPRVGHPVTAGLVLAQVVDPTTAQEIAGMFAGIIP